MNNKLFVMNYNGEKIGEISKYPDKFVLTMNGSTVESYTLPKIMWDIAPEPTQFPSAIEVLEYYKMAHYDVWEFFCKSHGIKSCNDYWFQQEPKGETWVPLIVGMQKYSSYSGFMREGDNFKIQNNGFVNVNRHSINILPECIKPYVPHNSESRFSSVTGYVYDLRDKPSLRGIIGRLILEFPEYAYKI